MAAVNDGPVADDDEAETQEDTAVVIDVKDGDSPGPSDESGQRLSVRSVSDPAHGTVEIVQSGPDAGKVRYTPDANFSGSDTFTYEVCEDGEAGKCDTARVDVEIGAVEDPPVARDDSYQTDEDRKLKIPASRGVLGNDQDGQGLSVVLVQGPKEGSLTLNEDGSFTYKPQRNTNGPDTFTYRIEGGAGGASNTATVTIDVKAVDEPPRVGSKPSTCIIKGTDRSETLRGTPGPDVICCTGGNDTIEGLGGDDVIYGGDGDDVITGGEGNDEIYGLGGKDTLDTNDGKEGNDLDDGGTERDKCSTDNGDRKANCP